MNTVSVSRVIYLPGAKRCSCPLTHLYEDRCVAGGIYFSMKGMLVFQINKPVVMWVRFYINIEIVKGEKKEIGY